MPHKPPKSVPIRSRNREPKKKPRWVPCRTRNCKGFGSYGFPDGTHLCSDCYPLSAEFQQLNQQRLADLIGADDDDDLL